MIFVTGATGLVGSHVLLKLLQRGKEVKALIRSNSSDKICRGVFKKYNSYDLFSKIQWVVGELNDIASLEEAMKDCNMLLHCAAIVSFDPKDRDYMYKVNVEGTANVMNVALSLPIEKVGYVSSIAALGESISGDYIDENCLFSKTKSVSYYSITKYLSEQEVWRASAEGLNVVIINPSVILGPGNWNQGSSQIFQKINNGLRFYTTGSTGYVDVLDVSEILVQLLFSKHNNERFIVNAVNLKYRDCFDKIAIALNKPKATIKVNWFLKEIVWRIEAVRSFFTKKSPLITKETASNAMTNKSYDSSKISIALNFKFIDIDQTIKTYADWYKSSIK